ncbi:MAG: RNA polymerase sigma factor [Bacteroidota bacterium]
MDESTFRQFYDATQKELWAYIRRMTGDESLASDFAQDAYIRFYNSSGRELHSSKWKAYLYRVATNIVYDHWRRNKRLKELTDVLDKRNSMNHQDDYIITHDIGEAFEQLTPQQRSLLWLAYVDEYKHKEIAEILNLSGKSIRVLLFRAKQRFIAILEKCEYHPEK